MATEVGSIEITCKSSEAINTFREFYNEFMQNRIDSDDYEDVWDHEDVEEEEIEETIISDTETAYSFEVDIYGLFDDPMETPLFELACQFIKNNPDLEFDLEYSMSWDNSGETWEEEYDYSNHVLKAETVFTDPYNSNNPVITTNRIFDYDGSDLIERT